MYNFYTHFLHLSIILFRGATAPLAPLVPTPMCSAMLINYLSSSSIIPSSPSSSSSLSSSPTEIIISSTVSSKIPSFSKYSFCPPHAYKTSSTCLLSYVRILLVSVFLPLSKYSPCFVWLHTLSLKPMLAQ